MIKITKRVFKSNGKFFTQIIFLRASEKKKRIFFIGFDLNIFPKPIIKKVLNQGVLNSYREVSWLFIQTVYVKLRKEIPVDVIVRRVLGKEPLPGDEIYVGDYGKEV